MKKIVLTVVLIVSLALIISAIFAVSCKTTPKDADYQYTKLYDANTGLDLTGAKYYKVKSGDTLSDISRNFYGDSFYYPIIMLASRGVVINPDKIVPGMELTIPDIERNKSGATSRRSMKNCLNGFAEIERRKASPNQGLIDGFRKHASAL